MLARKLTPLVFSLAALAWPWSIAAVPMGVLTAQASAKPARIEPGGKAVIRILANDGFQQPIASASIKISTDTGYFEASNQNVVLGFTDKYGVFQAAWHSNLQTPVGLQTFEITANKNGYIAKYPVTATAQVTVTDPAQDADPAQGNQNFQPRQEEQ